MKFAEFTIVGYNPSLDADDGWYIRNERIMVNFDNVVAIKEVFGPKSFKMVTLYFSNTTISVKKDYDEVINDLEIKK